MSMHRRFRPLIRALAVGLALIAGPAAAQWGGSDPYSGRDRVLRCESDDGRTRHCDADTRHGVRLLRQLSRADCREGRTWGVDRGGVWVRGGCRAEFALGYGASPEGSHAGRVFRCESNDDRREYCRVDTRGGVALVRRLSRSSCDRGRDWDASRDGVWVDHGCRAEFRTLAGGDPGYGHDGVQRLRCESDGRTRYCPVSSRGRAQLLRQLSAAPCREGRSWGRDGRGLWVSQGCRAEFQVGAQGNGWGAGQYPGGHHDSGYGQGQLLRCESNDGRVRRCAAPVYRGVELVRQLSRTACVQGRSWGWERGGVWVSQGCRGEFRTW